MLTTHHQQCFKLVQNFSLGLWAAPTPTGVYSSNLPLSSHLKFRVRQFAANYTGSLVRFLLSSAVCFPSFFPVLTILSKLVAIKAKSFVRSLPPVLKWQGDSHPCYITKMKKKNADHQWALSVLLGGDLLT